MTLLRLPSPLPTVAGLWRYPIASCGGERLDSVAMDTRGLQGDRAFTLVCRRTGETASPENDKRWRKVTGLSARGFNDTLEVSLPGQGWQPAHSSVSAISAHLGFEVEIRPTAERLGPREVCTEAVPSRYPRLPLHVISSASLRTLQVLQPDSVIDVRRFRPNLLLACDASGATPEIGWVGKSLWADGIEIEIMEATRRCPFTILEQNELPFDPKIFRTIARRLDRTLGVGCKISGIGTICVGQEVHFRGPPVSLP